ncbi:MAG: oxidoreductase [Cyanobacteria bacterium P01_A01_bin.17]
MTFNLDTVSSQKGRIAIATGANTGIGYETALGLAQTGMKVIMACRNLDKAEQAKKSILAKVPDADLDIIELDLSKLSSVRMFADTYRQQFSHLDLLINNAGIMIPPYTKTEDGFESQMGVNHLGHFLLTALLLDLMPDTPEVRVVSLSSNAHKLGKINFDDLQSERNYSRFGAYAQSKLACLMFANELSRKLVTADRKTLSVCAHPGGSDTELSRHMSAGTVTLLKLSGLGLITHSPADAALPTLCAALATDVSGGDYFGPQGFLEMSGKPGKVAQSNSAQDQDVTQQLWETSKDLTGVTDFCV